MTSVFDTERFLFLMPLVPAVFALMAWTYNKANHKNNLILVEAVPATCAATCIMIRLLVPTSNPALWFLTASFLFSIFGDLHMKKKKSDRDFILGILFFLLAHLGFLGYALTKASFSWLVFVVITIPFLVLFFAVFLPSDGLRGKKVLPVIVLAYLLASCLTLAASIDLESGNLARWVFAAAIVSLLTSDTFIAFREFFKVRAIRPFVMPLYYLCHVLIALSVTLEYVL